MTETAHASNKALTSNTRRYGRAGMRVAFSAYDWDKSTAWYCLEGQQIPGCPMIETQAAWALASGTQYRHAWRKDHVYGETGPIEWAWVYVGREHK